MISVNDSSVFINGNYQLSTYATSGNGTEQNPYIIENFNIEITNQTASAFEIQDTTSYFIIRNMTVSAKYGNGIYFYNVQNGKIENNFIQSSSNGFYIEKSNNITIIDSQFKSNNLGLLFQNSYNINLENSVFNQNNSTIALFNSYNCSFQSNNFSNNEAGAYIDNSNQTLWMNNRFTYTIPNSNSTALIRAYYGFLILRSFNNEFIENFCSNSSVFYYSQLSNGNTFMYNFGEKIAQNFVFVSSNNSIVSDNTGQNIDNVGMYKHLIVVKF